MWLQQVNIFNAIVGHVKANMKLRLPQIWGEDAHIFNPARWMNPDLNSGNENKVGVYANL